MAEDNTARVFDLPARIISHVPFKVEPDRVYCWDGERLLCLHEIDAGVYLEEVVSVQAVSGSFLQEGTVAYAARGKDYSFSGRVGIYCGEQFASAVERDSFQAEIFSPLTGKVVRVSVTADSQIKKGMELVVIEAMKMENVIHATNDGIVASIKVKPEANVNTGDLLLTLRRK